MAERVGQAHRYQALRLAALLDQLAQGFFEVERQQRLLSIGRVLENLQQRQPRFVIDRQGLCWSGGWRHLAHGSARAGCLRAQVQVHLLSQLRIGVAILAHEPGDEQPHVLRLFCECESDQLG